MTVIEDFNPRLREGGDKLRFVINPRKLQFQSTPPRRRRRRGCSHLQDCIEISIHASEKEATLNPMSRKIQKGIFQSTPPRRRRPLILPEFSATFCISIHASEKEATLFPRPSHQNSGISIHASEKEATRIFDRERKSR